MSLTEKLSNIRQQQDKVIAKHAEAETNKAASALALAETVREHTVQVVMPVFVKLEAAITASGYHVEQRADNVHYQGAYQMNRVHQVRLALRAKRDAKVQPDHKGGGIYYIPDYDTATARVFYKIKGKETVVTDTADATAVESLAIERWIEQYALAAAAALGE